MNRACNECSLCCKLLPMQKNSEDRYPDTIKFLEQEGILKPGEHLSFLRDFDKPGGHRCPHQRHRKGCAVYNIRPMGCRVWSCRWLFDEDTAALRRPDRAHYVLDSSPDFVTSEDENGEQNVIPVMQVWLDPGFPDAYRDVDLYAYFAKQFHKGTAVLVRVTREESIFIIGPPMTDEWHELHTLQDPVEHTPARKAEVLQQMNITLTVSR